MLDPNPHSAKIGRPTPDAFWLRLLNDTDLEKCDNLEKILVGCEILAALDGEDLLAA